MPTKLLLILAGPPAIALLLQLAFFRKLHYAVGLVVCLSLILYPVWFVAVEPLSFLVKVAGLTSN